MVVKQYFTTIAAIQNMGVLKQIWLYENLWGHITDMSKYHKAGEWSMN